jgi:hypothetical protein
VPGSGLVERGWSGQGDAPLFATIGGGIDDGDLA